MEATGTAKGTITLDVILTWIDKILGRLQSLVHDYPGLNNLKVELRHLLTILPCARFLSSDQPSILSPFSEKLQNFFFLLRSEDRILSVLAEEISRFQESVKSFREQICEWNTIMFDSILDKLQPFLCSYPRDDHGLNKLRVELKLTKTFCLCLINYREQLSTESSISEVKSSIYENASQFYYHLLRLEEALLHLELAEAFSIFRESFKSYKQPIHELYTRMLDVKDYSSPWLTGELVEFFDSLLDSLADIVIWGGVYDPTIENLLEPLQEKLIFLKNFHRFATLGVEDPLRLHRLFIHCQVSAVNAAHLCYTCWFYRDDNQVYNDLQSRSSELMEKIKPINQVSQYYIDTLKTSRQSISSFLLKDVPDIHIVEDFVDSLLYNLWEFLDWGANFLITMELQMQMLGEGLKFLRTILKQEKFCGLQMDIKHCVINVVYEAADIIFQLYKLSREEGLAKDMDLGIFHLMEKIDLIKVEVAEKFPVSSTSNLPAANGLECIDLILENLKELACQKVDYRTLQVQKGLESLRSFMENIQEHHKHDQMLYALWRRAVEVAYKADFVIGSLTARGMSPYSLMLFDALAKEIMSFIETLKIDDKKYASQAQGASKISSREPPQGARSAINEIVVGFDDEANAIIDQLVTKQKELDITFIVGMPGLGKTTLAKKVYQDFSVTHHFHVRAWSYVSQICSRKDVLLDILRSGFPEHSNQDNEKNEDDLAEKLYRNLKGKRYLIVLDDIWDIEAWNVLERCFPRDDFGSRILLTGRSYFSIKPTAAGPYHLRRLTDDECWELLQKKLDHKEDLLSFMREIGWQIARNCKGLPFTVIIVAGILANLEQVDWEEVANSLSSNVLGGTEGKSLLELSYRHLPDFLKPCLLYMAAFPQGQEISIQRLMWLWIAEGLVKRSELYGLEDIAEKNEQKDVEDIAEDNIMALINRNLVMVAKQGSMGNVKTCQIHDLLHEFCVVKSREENVLQVISGRDNLFKFDEPPNLRRLCIHSQPKHFVKSRLFCPRIRSLLFHSQGAGSSTGTSYSLSFVFHVKLLSVLDLGQINLGLVFPDAIIMLFQLRYLAVRGGINDIPSSIAKLSNLETLLVTVSHKGSSGFSLPNTLWDMQKLRHIQVRGCLVDVKDNLESSSSLDNLTTLSTPKLYIGHTMERIMRKFPKLRKLKCSFLDSEMSNEDSEEIVEIKFPCRLEMLNLILCNVANLLCDKLHFPSNLKKLTLAGFSWGMISSIWKLPNLEVLKLLNGSNDGVNIWEMEEEEEFPSLKFLKLEYLDIVRWTGSGDHFPCLQRLVLEGCNELEELPSCLGTISTLDLIKVYRCPDVVGTLVGEIEKELKSWGNEDVKILISEEFEKD